MQATVDANTFRSPKAPSVSVKDRTIDAHKCMYAHYRPYTPRNRVTPLELRFVVRSLESSSHTGMTMEDVIQVCHALIDLAIYQLYFTTVGPGIFQHGSLCYA